MTRKTLGAAFLAFWIGVALTAPAWAEFRLREPDAEPGEFELEHNGSYGFDSRAAHRAEQSYTAEIGYGVTDFWHTEIEGEWSRDPGPGNRTRFTALTSENVFQFTERGEYWADVGFFAEYGRGLPRGTADEITLGPLLRKQIGPTINVLNVFLEKEVGSYAAGPPQLLYAWETRLALGKMFEPGIEFYGQPGAIGHFAAWRDQDLRAGPVL